MGIVLHLSILPCFGHYDLTVRPMLVPSSESAPHPFYLVLGMTITRHMLVLCHRRSLLHFVRPTRLLDVQYGRSIPRMA